METIKSFTSLEQSKVLAKILPIESADMYYQYVLPKSDKIKHNPEIGNPINALKWYNKGYTMFGKEPITLDEYCIPCWSLAALLNYMHKVDLFPDITDFNGEFKLVVSYVNEEEEKILVDVQTIIERNEDLIDACVAMIVKLNEQKLL